MTSYLRPDEKATQSEIRKAQTRTGEVRSGIQQVSSLGATAFGGKVLSKVLPFLSEYIPEDLAYKGINKIMPALGGFLKNGMNQGLSLKSGLDFLKNQISQQSPEQSQQSPAKQNKNIIEQYSPNLHQYLLDLIKSGNTPIQAAVKARKFLKDKDQEVIDKLEKDHKSSWSDIVQSVFGSGGQALPQNQSQAALHEDAMNPPYSQPTRPPSAEAQAAASQTGNPQAKQQLLQAMQALSQKLRT